MTSNALAKLETIIEKRSDLLVEDEKLSSLIRQMRPAAQRGYLRKAEFLKICQEKSARRIVEAQTNSHKTIRTTTQAAYAVPDEYVRALPRR